MMQRYSHSAPVKNRSSVASISKKGDTAGPTIQARLNIGKPNDHFEKEADQVADRVVSQNPAPQQIQTKCAACGSEEKLQRMGNEEEIQTKPISLIQRQEDEELQAKPLPLIQKVEKEEMQMKSAGGQQTASAEVSSQIYQSKGGGSPLPFPIQQQMESGIGADFSRVRIHTGTKAENMSQQLNAQAFTVGNDIFFNRGKYSPSSSSGQHLLAHELTHTVQQGKSSQIQRKPTWEKFNKKGKVKHQGKFTAFSPKKLSPSGPFSKGLVTLLATLFSKPDVRHTAADGQRILAMLESSATFIKYVKRLDKFYKIRANGGIVFDSGTTGSRFIPKGNHYKIHKDVAVSKAESDTILVSNYHGIDYGAGGSIKTYAATFARSIIHETAHAYRHARRWGKFRGLARHLFDEYRTREMEVKILGEILNAAIKAGPKDPLKHTPSIKRLKSMINAQNLGGKTTKEKLLAAGQSQVSGTHLTYVEKYLWGNQFNIYHSLFLKASKGLDFKKYRYIKLPPLTSATGNDLTKPLKALQALGNSLSKKNDFALTIPDPEKIVVQLGYTGFKDLEKILKTKKMSQIEKYMVSYLLLISYTRQRIQLEEYREKNNPGASQSDALIKRFLGIDGGYEKLIKKDTK